MKTLLIGIVTIAIYFAILANNGIKVAYSAELIGSVGKDHIQQEKPCQSVQSATEELTKKVKQIRYIDLDELDSQRMIKFVQKYHKPDLVADSTRLFFSPRHTTALIGFSFEDCVVFQMVMDLDKINQIMYAWKI